MLHYSNTILHTPICTSVDRSICISEQIAVNRQPVECYGMAWNALHDMK